VQELSLRFKDRNGLQGPMEEEIKAATSLAVMCCCMLLLLHAAAAAAAYCLFRLSDSPSNN
jgi:hypothetical protein